MPFDWRDALQPARYCSLILATLAYFAYGLIVILLFSCRGACIADMHIMACRGVQTSAWRVICIALHAEVKEEASCDVLMRG